MSAATASSTAPSKQAYQNSAALQKVLNVPYISESINYADSTMKAHPLIQQTYQLGENVVNTSLNLAQPITSRIAPQLSLLDQYAVKGLDYAESKWSYPFTATSSDLYQNATGPARQVLELVGAYQQAISKTYNERVATPAHGAYDSAHKQFEDLKAQNAYLQRATKIVDDLQAQLGSTVEQISGRGKKEGDAAARQAQGYSNAIFAELDRVRGFASQLPAESHKRLQPVLATFSESYEKLSKEARDSSVPASNRFMNVLKYVREQSLPALQKAIVHPESTSAAPKVNGSQ